MVHAKTNKYRFWIATADAFLFENVYYAGHRKLFWSEHIKLSHLYKLSAFCICYKGFIVL